LDDAARRAADRRAGQGQPAPQRDRTRTLRSVQRPTRPSAVNREAAKKITAHYSAYFAEDQESGAIELRAPNKAGAAKVKKSKAKKVRATEPAVTAEPTV